MENLEAIQIEVAEEMVATAEIWTLHHAPEINLDTLYSEERCRILYGIYIEMIRASSSERLNLT